MPQIDLKEMIAKQYKIGTEQTGNGSAGSYNRSGARRIVENLEGCSCSRTAEIKQEKKPTPHPSFKVGAEQIKKSHIRKKVQQPTVQKKTPQQTYDFGRSMGGEGNHRTKPFGWNKTAHGKYIRGDHAVKDDVVAYHVDKNEDIGHPDLPRYPICISNNQL